MSMVQVICIFEMHGKLSFSIFAGFRSNCKFISVVVFAIALHKVLAMFNREFTNSLSQKFVVIDSPIVNIFLEIVLISSSEVKVR